MSLITGRALAKELGVTPATVINYAKSGMPHIYIGKQRKYIKEDVLQWFKDGANSSEVK